MQLPYTKLKQTVRQFINLPDACAYLFLSDVLLLVSYGSNTEINTTDLPHCNKRYNYPSHTLCQYAELCRVCIWLVCRLCTTLHTKCCGVVIVIGQYCIAYSSQMAKHNFVKNMNSMHKSKDKNAIILGTQL